MISLEALPKVIDISQLTPDLEGTLQYDHAQWIDLRLVSTLFSSLNFTITGIRCWRL